MASLIEGYNYDIFISYRQKDNKYDGWVTEFVDNLKKELEATFKEEISVYFDINPHDGLLETHDVDASIKDKLKCVVFIPIISRTYCDPKSFAWEHEFKAFVEQASNDQFGLKIKLPNGNFANRVLPIKIYDLENTDIKLCEAVLGGVLRGIEFIFKSAGVNRPLTPSDNPEKNQYKTFYRDQINKVANAIKENISGLKGEPLEFESESNEVIATIKNSSVKEKSIKVTAGFKKRVLLVSMVLLAAAVIVVALILTNVIKGGKAAKAEGIKSLVVLPFENYTGDEHLDYVADGMHASLIGDMGKLGALRVIGKTSSSVFKNTDKSAPDIARELHVDALVEPTVTCYGDSVCIQIRVITPFPEEKQLWVADYREDKKEMMNLFNRIAKQIADELMIKLTPKEEQLLTRSKTIDRDAYDVYLRSFSYVFDISKESLQKNMEYLNSAIQKEPRWAPLYSGLAQVWMAKQQMGFEPPSVATPEIYKNLNKALELDPDLSEAHYLRAMIAHLMEWDLEKSEKEFLSALAVNPSDAQSRMLYAQLLCVLQRPDEAVTQSRLAFDLDPLSPLMKCWYGSILPALGDCKTAVDLAEEVTAADPGHYLANWVILLAAFRCKEYDKVIKAERYLLPVYNIKEDEIKEIERIFNQQDIVKAYEKIMIHLEKFAENNPISPLDIAIRYIMANQPDKAMDWIKKGFEQHDPNMAIITIKELLFDPLFNNPRFINIVKKMNFPLPKN